MLMSFVMPSYQYAASCSWFAVSQSVFGEASGWGETLRAFSSISLKVLTQRYVYPPMGQRGQSARYKQLWMKYEAFLITPGSSEGAILLSAVDDVRGEHSGKPQGDLPFSDLPPSHQLRLVFFHHLQGCSFKELHNYDRPTWRCWCFFLLVGQHA